MPLPDRGLDFGDGLFETLLLRGGEPLYPELHLARLWRGCEALSFPDCQGAVRDQLKLAAAAAGDAGWRWTALRLTLTRGEGPRGYAPPEKSVPRIVITATELGADLPQPGPPAVLGLATIRWSSQPLLAGLKHLNRLEQVLAAQQRRREGVDEAIMLDQSGQVISVTSGNLFLVSSGQLLTAPVDQCGIAGTRRQLVMQRWAPAIGLVPREAMITMSELEEADEAFYSNSLVGLRPIASFGNRRWQSHDMCHALYQQYLDDLA